MTWLKYGDYTNEIAYGILGFAGMKPFVSTYGPGDKVSEEHRKKWLNEIAALGRRAK